MHNKCYLNSSINNTDEPAVESAININSDADYEETVNNDGNLNQMKAQSRKHYYYTRNTATNNKKNLNSSTNNIDEMVTDLPSMSILTQTIKKSSMTLTTKNQTKPKLNRKNVTQGTLPIYK